ncbi:MAG: hypothetical protein EKK64_08550 [Neisseriaceae bacterium]|nr:MAG: hypothetical protein EKK64_08550 [Neisseriaceae bacterium]
MSLTVEQKDVVRNIIKGIPSNQITTLGGYAGTGKSTIIKIILQTMKKKGFNFIPCAYTGKAANVLRKKGMENANTIHSTIYQTYVNEQQEVFWDLKSKNLIQQEIDGFIIDEASMVSKEIHEDLKQYGLPIIYVGDHGQLEPIGAANFNLMSNPMYTLEQVHRNAGEIAFFANHLRNGNIAEKFDGGNKVKLVTNSVVKSNHLAEVDQVICAFNKTRVELNERVRVEKKIELTYIAKGEKIICLRNNRQLGLFNGMQGIVKKVLKDSKFTFVSDGFLYEKIPYMEDQFGQVNNQFKFSETANPFDYGYAITCHKAQGDEWNNVIVFEQPCDKWDHTRWAYTAASRAKFELIWVQSARFTPSYLD